MGRQNGSPTKKKKILLGYPSKFPTASYFDLDKSVLCKNRREKLEAEARLKKWRPQLQLQR